MLDNISCKNTRSPHSQSTLTEAGVLLWSFDITDVGVAYIQQYISYVNV